MSYLSPALASLPAAWREVLAAPSLAPRLQSIDAHLMARAADGVAIYPPRELIFNALHHMAPQDVRVVILGQDPYHGAGEAMGLSFSVPGGVKIPPSLRNMYKELASDLGMAPAGSGDLTHWARQGVLLLNTSLTVEQARAGSHAAEGWGPFTDKVIEAVNRECEGVVFLLWGSHAQSKEKLIDPTRHLILKSAHPSPLSAYRGFLGNGHFSRTNKFLEQRGKTPIDWRLPAL